MIFVVRLLQKPFKKECLLEVNKWFIKTMLADKHAINFVLLLSDKISNKEVTHLFKFPPGNDSRISICKSFLT